MLSEEAITFIGYYTGDFRETIVEAYNNYLRIKYDCDFNEFHPPHIKKISPCKDKKRAANGPCKYPIGTCEDCSNI